MMEYKRVSTSPTKTKCNVYRGIRLNVRKISIHKLRVIKFMNCFFFKMLYKWRKSYQSVMKSIRKIKSKSFQGVTSTKSTIKSSRHLIKPRRPESGFMLLDGTEKVIVKSKCCSRLRSLGRTNSFYSEAIADCLEFIKRNSVSLHDDRHGEHAATQIFM